MPIEVNPQQLIDEGFIILRQVIPPERLDALRASYETVVERQHKIWSGELTWDEPVVNYKAKQPRIVLNTVVDAATADTVEFCLHDNTLGVSRQLFGAPDAAPTALFFMCNPKTDHGPDGWHRDSGKESAALLRCQQEDLLANGPGSVQWNIPLYDDDVLWVVPGSHRRAATKAEKRQLQENPRVPLPGGLPVKLEAGDGVVYSNMIFHWPSNYSTRLRRTIHLGYRSFGGPLYPYNSHFYWDLKFTKHLSPSARAKFERFAALHAQERNRVEALLRAMLTKDRAAFRSELGALHSGQRHRIVCAVLLSKLAVKIRDLKRPEVASLPLAERAKAVGEKATTLYLTEDVAQRFSTSEANVLQQRFAPLAARLRSDAQSLDDFGVDQFIASWDDSA